MKQMFSAEGVRALRTPAVLLVMSIAVAVALVVGSNLYLDREKRESANSGRRLQEARVRLDNARRERDSQQESAEVFRTLVERGLSDSSSPWCSRARRSAPGRSSWGPSSIRPRSARAWTACAAASPPPGRARARVPTR